MSVTPDVIGVIVAIFVAMITVLGGIGGLLSRQNRWIEARFEKVDREFAAVRAEFVAVRAEIAGVRDEVVEVKIAVARLEGPQPRLLRPSH